MASKLDVSQVIGVAVPLVTEVIGIFKKLQAEKGVEPTVEEVAAQLKADAERVIAGIDAWEAANPVVPEA